MKRNLKFGIFVLAVVLLVSVVLAAINPPTALIFRQNDTANYDNDGAVWLNWTAPASGAHNYTIFISKGEVVPFTAAKNNTATGYIFTNTTDANYTFIVQAENVSVQANSTANVTWMVIDSTIPALLYNSNTGASGGQNKIAVFVNVTVSDINNVSSKLIFEIHNSTGLWNRTTFPYSADGIQTINWTGLVDGIYTFNVTANDSATNENSTTSRSFYLDSTAPAATATCTTTVHLNGAFPCTCTGSDTATIGSGVSTSVGTSNAPEGTAAPQTIGLFTYTCTVTDDAGNSDTDTAAYTVLGSGSGGNTGSTPTSKRIYSFAKITPGTAGVVKDFNAGTGLKQIQIEVANEAQNVVITVTKYDGKPAGVSVSKTGKVYQYVQIDAQNLAGKLDKATVQFKVEKSWTVSNGLGKDEISVYKFDETGGKWNELSANYLSEDSTYYYYSAEVSSFSYFVISEKSLVSGEGTGTTASTPTPEKSRSLLWLWILIAVVVVFFGWQIMKKRRR